MKYLLYIATFVIIATYQFWDELPKGSFYIGIALFINLLCMYLYLSNKKSFICFLLFGLSINNLADELFFDPTVLQLNEVLFAFALLAIWALKKLLYGTEIHRQ